MLADPDFERIRQELRTISGQLGEARNLDVLLGRVEDRVLYERIDAERAKAYDRAIDALTSLSFRGFMLDLGRWIDGGSWQSMEVSPKLRDQPIEAFAEHTLDRFSRRVKRQGARLAAIDVEARHQVRIEAKKLRYAAEFFASLYGDRKSRQRLRSDIRLPCRGRGWPDTR